MRLQSAIFDMDGTLLDSMPIWDEIGPRTLRAQGIEPEPGLHDKLKVMTFREGAQYCKDTYHLPQTVEQVMDMTKAQVKDFYNHQVEAKPGLKKFLSLLKMEGVWMYVATNTDRDLAEAGLKHAGIDCTLTGLSPPMKRFPTLTFLLFLRSVIYFAFHQSKSNSSSFFMRNISNTSSRIFSSFSLM